MMARRGAEGADLAFRAWSTPRLSERTCSGARGPKCDVHARMATRTAKASHRVLKAGPPETHAKSDEIRAPGRVVQVRDGVQARKPGEHGPEAPGGGDCGDGPR